VIASDSGGSKYFKTVGQIDLCQFAVDDAAHARSVRIAARNDTLSISPRRLNGYVVEWTSVICHVTIRSVIPLDRLTINITSPIILVI